MKVLAKILRVFMNAYIIALSDKPVPIIVLLNCLSLIWYLEKLQSVVYIFMLHNVAMFYDLVTCIWHN